MGENNNDNEDHNPEKEDEKGADNKSKGKKGFAISQTLAPMSLDLGLLTSNVNQLRHLIDKGSEAINTINITLICGSIVLQTVVAILIAKNYFNLKETKKHNNATNINTAISIISIFITVINVWIASFDEDKKITKKLSI